MSSHPLILGARVADAATMGFHWLYDQVRIRQLAPDAPEFRAPNAADYDGVPGYFAHATRSVGQGSQYGEQVRVMEQALAANGGTYDADTYAAAFRGHFGYGGAYVGYIDRATRDTLNNAVGVENPGAELGSGDVQLPAIAKLPPLVAAMLDADDASFDAAVRSAVRVTNANPTAEAYGIVAAHMMRAATRAPDAAGVLTAARAVATPEIAALLDAAAAMTDASNEAAAQHFGLPCNLSQGVPVALHNILTAPSYTEAVRRNIYAGGDNCGRAILVGAVMGALHGAGGETGIPQDWVAYLTQV